MAAQSLLDESFDCRYDSVTEVGGPVAETFKVTIARQYYGPDATAGYVMVNGEAIGYTIELPWKDNKNDVSCVRPGTYQGFIRYDHKDRWRIELLDVPGRTHVQIHTGNSTSDIKGCILPGAAIDRKLKRIVDGQSKPAYERLKVAFYGTSSPNSCPDKKIIVEILNGPPR